MTSFAAKLASSSTQHVVDLRVTLGGEARYFIVQLKPTHVQAFKQAVARDEGFTIEDYGTILHRGYGEPEDSVKTMLHARYGLVYA